jgi:hypothetical protein
MFCTGYLEWCRRENKSKRAAFLKGRRPRVDFEVQIMLDWEAEFVANGTAMALNPRNILAFKSERDSKRAATGS